MHILMVSRGVVPVGRRSGGAEHVCYELARHLADEGDDVVLVSNVDDSLLAGAPEQLAVATIACDGWAQQLLWFPASFVRWLLQHLVGNVRAARRAWDVLLESGSIDVIHSHGAFATLLVARRLRASASTLPLVYTEHDSTPWACRYRGSVERVVRRCIYRQVNLRACRAAASVVTNFSSLADELAAKTNMERSHFTTVRNGADLQESDVEAGSDDLARQHGVDRYCLFVGALVDRKGPDILIRALAQVELPCIVVGDGPLRPALERLASRLGISERVFFTGALEPRDVHRYYRGAEVLVLPSVSEGVPLVAMEAIGVGLPVVASDLDGIASIVHDGENGLLVRPGDLASLVSALSLVEHDGSVLASLRRGAAASSSEVIGWDVVARQIHYLYELLRSTSVPALGVSDNDCQVTLADVISWPGPTAGLPWESDEAQQWRRAA